MRSIRAGKLVTLGLVAAGLCGSAGGCSSAGGANKATEATPGSSGTTAGGVPVLTPGTGTSGGLTFGNAAQTMGCSQLDISFEAQTPTVLLVVDRSSSQWDNYPNDTWDPMKNGILQVVQQVQKDVRFGMVTYTGQNGGVCPDLFPSMNQVTFDKNNYDAIAANLNAVQKPSYKGETPTALTLQEAVPVLLADP
ncbi:MAG TPA: hypothetical protein VG963_29115, partial [Polyangiaceae bacterium]|nr:hypothetical protein [Polyangiaceae bacterium]